MQLTLRKDRKSRQQLRSTESRLSRMSILRHCDAAELRQLATIVVAREVPSGTVLCRVGEPATETFLVESGVLAVVRGDRTVAAIASGDIAGELAPLGSTVRTADLVARTDCSLFVVPAGRLASVLADSIGLRRGLTRVLADRTEELRRLAAEERATPAG